MKEIGNNAGGPEIITLSGPMFLDEVVGSEEVASAGKTATVHYTGWLENGKRFDGSVDRGQPFSFHFGLRQTSKGWDEGVQGVRMGGNQRLKIPANLRDGAGGAADTIPPYATVIFEIELLGV
jgi:FKBP-type peptidyl-prolyl cis-trans isomerase